MSARPKKYEGAFFAAHDLSNRIVETIADLPEL